MHSKAEAAVCLCPAHNRIRACISRATDMQQNQYLVSKSDLALFSDHDNTIRVVFTEQVGQVTTADTNVGSKGGLFGSLYLCLHMQI